MTVVEVFMVGVVTEEVELLVLLSTMLGVGVGVEDSEVVSTIVEEGTGDGVGVVDSAMVELGITGVVEIIARVVEIIGVLEKATFSVVGLTSIVESKVGVDNEIGGVEVTSSSVELASSIADVISPDVSKSILGSVVLFS